MRQELQKDLLFVLLLTIVFGIGCFMLFGCGGHTPQPPSKPTPTPVPDTHITAQGTQIFINGVPAQLRGIGLYFSFERRLSDTYLHELFSYLQSYNINMVRVFVISTFQKHRLNELGIPSWQIFKTNAQGKYDLTKINTDWLCYVRNYYRIANDHGICVMANLTDVCGFKDYGTEEYGIQTHPFNSKNNVNRWPGTYPDNKWLWKSITCQYINATCQEPNAIVEYGNELYELDTFCQENYLNDMLNHLHLWTTQQYQNSNSPYKPVFASSDVGAYLWGTNKLNIQWSHSHLNGTQHNGVSTDGYRCDKLTLQEFGSKIKNHYKNGKHVEMHMAFLSPLVGGDPTFLMSHVWNNNKLATMNQYEHYFSDYLAVFRELK